MEAKMLQFQLNIAEFHSLLNTDNVCEWRLYQEYFAWPDSMEVDNCIWYTCDYHVAFVRSNHLNAYYTQ